MVEKVSLGGLPVGGNEPLISSAVRWGDLLFLSGRAPLDPTTMEVVVTGFTVPRMLIEVEVTAGIPD